MSTENAARNGPRYDVAISFLSSDEAIGTALRDRLSEGLTVFFYPHNQEELAGTDGLESMREPFLNDARVVVVLYREPWGKTPWTRVEETAIKDGCLDQGWDRLFFITLDAASVLPKWLPRTHVRFNYETFPIEQAVGAIKARVLECGGSVQPMTALKRAELYKVEAAYQKERQAISSYEGMRIVRAKTAELMEEINRLCDQIRNRDDVYPEVGSNPGRCVMRNRLVSLCVGFSAPYTNSVDRCELIVSEFAGGVILPNTNEMYFREPKELNRKTFVPELSHAREYGWVEKHGKTSEFLTSDVLAERCVIQYLDLTERADRGEVTPLDW